MSLAWLMALCALFAGGARQAPAAAAASTGAEMADSASGYRARLAALALATGRVPRIDGFIDPPRGAHVPWPPLFPALLQRVMRRALPQSAQAAGRGELDQARFEQAAARLIPWVALLGAALAGWCAHVLTAVRGSLGRVSAAARSWSVFVAVLCSLLILNRPVVPRPVRLEPGPYVAVFVFVAIAIAVRAVQVKLLVDRMIAALLAGFSCGLAFMCAVETWPLAVCAFVGLFVAARRRGEPLADVVRGQMVFLMPLLAVVLVPRSAIPWGSLAPSWELGWRGMLATSGQLWLYAVVFPIAWWFAWSRPRSQATSLLLLLAAGSFVLGVLDRRFELLFGATFVCTLALALQELWIRTAGFTRAVLGLTALLVLSLSAVRLNVSVGRSSPEHPESWSPPDTGYIAGLSWMRDHTPSSGAWNHPDARQDWSVMCDPLQAGSVLWLARRPVAAATFSGASVGEAQRAVARALLREEPREFTADLHALNTPWVVAAPRQLADLAALRKLARSGEPASENTALARLALAGADAPPDHYPGLERVYVSEVLERVPASRSAAGPVSAPSISIYRLTAPAPGRPEASLKLR
jgi:hypothetical protein